MTPAAVLAQARALVDGRAAFGGWWPRAAAMLARRALEMELAIRISAHRGDPERASFSGQWLVLPAVVAPDVARRAAWAWGGLSAVIHQRGYEIAPTVDELEGWFAAVEGLLAAKRR